MRLITKKIRNKIIKSRSTDLRAHMWFRYHKHLFGRLILSGFKIRAFNQLLDLKYSLKLKEKLDPNLVFLVSMIKATPLILLLPVRMGSFTQGIPMPMTEKKQITFAVKWVLKAAKNSRSKFSIKSLADILLMTIYDQGPIFEKKVTTYDSGLKNRHLLRRKKFFK